MGIPYYFYTVYKKYNKTKLMLHERDVSQMSVDHLFFDYNSLIHPCAQKALSELKNDPILLNINGIDDISKTQYIEDHIISETIKYTEIILKLLQSKNVHITIDGVAPRAKINQQRERRYKSYFFKCANVNANSKTDTINSSNELNIQNDTSLWDSNKITPGTFFMKKMSDALVEFAERIRVELNCNVLISDSDECGEGEHKMMKWIAKYAKEHERIMVYGLDADLIMLSLMNTYANSIVLLRDNTFNTKIKEEERTFTYLDIGTLKSAICTDIRTEINDETISISNESILQDYIFLCFLLGNDFIENIPSLIIRENGVNMLLKIYIKILKTLKQTIINDKNKNERINMVFLANLFRELAKNENYFFTNIWSVYKKKKEHVKVENEYTDSKTELTKIVFLKDDFIKFNTQGYKKRYYMYYGINNVNDACEQYIKTLHWVYGYYQSHSHNNWLWFYPYHATPLASDIANYLTENCRLENFKFEETKCIEPIEQLIMVLPRESLLSIIKESDAKQMMNIYEKLNRYFRTTSHYLEKNFPEKIVVDVLHKEYLWQSKILFDNFDISILKNFLNIV